jgi:hypothetical protein
LRFRGDPEDGAAPASIDDLMARGVLAKDAAGGRSTSYSLRATGA